MELDRDIVRGRYEYQGGFGAEITRMLTNNGSGNNNYKSYTQFTVQGGDTTQYNRNNNNIEQTGETREVFVYEHTGNGISNNNNNAGAGEVYIVAHGWNPAFTDFLEIANIVKTAKPAARVLVVDWMQAAETKDKLPVGGTNSPNYKAVTWIGAIAQRLSNELQQDITSSSINFIGHSFGTLLSSETARVLPGNVNTITALDPPSEGDTGGYDLYPSIPERQGPADYSAVSNYSRAYVGSRSIAGNQGLAATAHESFQMDFGVGFRAPGSEHGWVVKTAGRLINSNDGRKLAENPFSSQQEKPNLFTLDDNQIHPQFQQNIPGFMHQGIMVVNSENEVQFLVAANSELTGTLVFGTNQDDDLSASNEISKDLLLRVGNNTFYADKGNDKVVSDTGNDTLYGGEGNDTLDGYIGDDFLYGEEGEDNLNGSFNDDELYGGEGNDTLDGSTGNDLAVFSDLFENYEYSISKGFLSFTDTITFAHTRGTQEDGTDKLKNIDYAEFSDVIVPLPLEDGPQDTNQTSISDNNGVLIASASLTLPTFMFDKDADYKISFSSSPQSIQYNIAYIIDVSGSMSGTPLQEAKSAYTSLTNSLVNSGIADVSQFVVIPFNSNASQSSPVDANEAISTIQGLNSGGGTDFTPALNTAYSFFSGLQTESVLLDNNGHNYT